MPPGGGGRIRIGATHEELWSDRTPDPDLPAEWPVLGYVESTAAAREGGSRSFALRGTYAKTIANCTGSYFVDLGARFRPSHEPILRIRVLVGTSDGLVEGLPGIILAGAQLAATSLDLLGREIVFERARVHRDAVHRLWYARAAAAMTAVLQPSVLDLPDARLGAAVHGWAEELDSGERDPLDLAPISTTLLALSDGQPLFGDEPPPTTRPEGLIRER